MHTLAGSGFSAERRKNSVPELQISKKKKSIAVSSKITPGFSNPLPRMPVPIETSSKKRKSSKNAGALSKRRAVAEEDNFADTLSTIQELENQIAESRKHYNNIATLISMLNVEGSAEKPELAVAVSLCRVFSRLIAAGNFTESSRAAESEKIVAAWLKERCLEYQRGLLAIMRGADTTSQVTALTLSMRLVKERVTHIPGADHNVWMTLFKDIFEAVVESEDGQDLRSEFVTKFVKEYEDVRFHTFGQISYVLPAIYLHTRLMSNPSQRIRIHSSQLRYPRHPYFHTLRMR